MKENDYALVRRFAAIRSAIDLDFGTIDPDEQECTRSFHIDSLLDATGHISYAAPWLVCTPDTFRAGLTLCTVVLNMHVLQPGETYATEIILTLQDERIVIPVRVTVRQFSAAQIEQMRAVARNNPHQLLAFMGATTDSTTNGNAFLTPGQLRMLYRRARIALLTEQWYQAGYLYRMLKAHDPDFAADEQLTMAEERHMQAEEQRTQYLEQINTTINIWQDIEQLLLKHQSNELYKRYLNHARSESRSMALIQQVYQLVEQDDWETLSVVLHQIDRNTPGIHRFSIDIPGLRARAAVEVGLEQAIASAAQQRWSEVQRILDNLNTSDPPVSWLQQYVEHKPHIEPTDADPIIVARDGRGHFNTLREAIQQAQNDAYIIVFPGVYEEHNRLTIRKSVKIIGQGAGDDVVIQTNQPACITISCDDVLLQGLTMQSSAGTSSFDTGALVVKKGYAIVSNCTISSTSGDGVFVDQDHAQLVLHQCHISGKQRGLVVSKGGTVIAAYCEITNSDKGVIHRGYAHLYSCLIKHNREGINGHPGAVGRIEQCEFQDNTRYSHDYTGSSFSDSVILRNNRDRKP
jgi:hypothetical protein